MPQPDRRSKKAVFFMDEQNTPGEPGAANWFDFKPKTRKDEYKIVQTELTVKTPEYKPEFTLIPLSKKAKRKKGRPEDPLEQKISLKNAYLDSELTQYDFCNRWGISVRRLQQILSELEKLNL